jgi:magnesium transporter
MMAAWKPPRAPTVEFWRSGRLQHDFTFDKISDYLAEPDTLVWADVCDPDHEALFELADELGLNRWAVEDCRPPSASKQRTIRPTRS